MEVLSTIPRKSIYRIKQVFWRFSYKFSFHILFGSLIFNYVCMIFISILVFGSCWLLLCCSGNALVFGDRCLENVLHQKQMDKVSNKVEKIRLLVVWPHYAPAWRLFGGKRVFVVEMVGKQHRGRNREDHRWAVWVTICEENGE